MEKETRRVGTVNLGASLLLFGIIFLIKIFIKSLTYSFVFRLWPIILILLGIEVIISYIKNNSKEMKYDLLSFVIIMIMTGFSVSMAWIDFIIITYRNYNI